MTTDCLFSSNTSEFGTLVGVFRAYISPVIALIGLLGNVLIFLVFVKEKPRTRFSIFAISLAIAHSISLIFNTVLDDFIGRGLSYATDGQLDIKLDSTSEFACKILEYIPQSMYFTASYLVVVFSIDRALTIYNPLRFYSVNYRKQAVLACLVVFLIGLLGNLPILVIQTIVVNDNRTRCQMNRYYTTLSNVSLYFTTVVTFFLPVIAVLVLNIFIVLQLWKFHSWRETQLSIKTRIVQELGRAAGHLALSTCFLLLYIPLGFVVLIRLHFTEIHQDDHSTRAKRITDLTRFFSSLKDIAYAVNCIIYFIFLKNFRGRLLYILHRLSTCFQGQKMPRPMKAIPVTRDSSTRNLKDRVREDAGK